MAICGAVDDSWGLLMVNKYIIMGYDRQFVEFDGK